MNKLFVNLQCHFDIISYIIYHNAHIISRSEIFDGIRILNLVLTLY